VHMAIHESRHNDQITEVFDRTVERLLLAFV
jgi:hypothetical protein